MRKYVLVGLIVLGLAGAAMAQQEEGLDFQFWTFHEVNAGDSIEIRAIDAFTGEYFYGRWSITMPNPPIADSCRIKFFELDGTTGAAVDSFIVRVNRAITVTDAFRADSIHIWNRNTSGISGFVIGVGSKGDASTWKGGRK